MSRRGFRMSAEEGDALYELEKDRAQDRRDFRRIDDEEDARVCAYCGTALDDESRCSLCGNHQEA